MKSEREKTSSAAENKNYGCATGGRRPCQQIARFAKKSVSYLLVLVGDTLWLSVHLLLPLFATTTKAQHQVQGALLLDVVVAQGAAILQLLAREDKALLIRGDALLVLDLLLHVLDSVAGLHVQGDSLTCQGLNEDLHLVYVSIGCSGQMRYVGGAWM